MVYVPLHRRLELIALRPDTTHDELRALAAAARALDCATLAVAGSRVALAAEWLDESNVKVAALVGFPFGSGNPDAKRYEIETAVDDGAQEIHAVVNHGWLRDGQDRALLREMRDWREAADERPVHALIELALLRPADIERITRLVIEAELQFLATATGCAGRAADPSDLARLRALAGPELGLKAVGGIPDAAMAAALVEAGANRLGVFDLTPFAALAVEPPTVDPTIRAG